MNTESLEAQAAAWLMRCEARDCPVEDRAELEVWLAADATHRAAYLRMKEAWDQADERLRRLRPRDGSVNPDLLDSILASLAASDPRLAAPLFPAGGEKPGVPPRYALATVLALTVVGLTTFALQRSDWQTYATDYGGFERVVLKDGSSINLNTNSAIRVHFTAHRRDVQLLRGEALFGVAPDAHRPFEVAAAGTHVRALSTAFSVRMQDKKQVQVLVTEGRVAIDPPEGRIEHPQTLPATLSTLSAGEAVTICANQLHVAKVGREEVSHRLGWMEGRLWFERQTLLQAVSEFNRYNRRQIEIADPAIAQLPIGGGFESTDPESFVAALEQVFRVRAFTSGSGKDETIRLVGTGET